MFLFYNWPFPHMCRPTLQRMQHISLLMIGSVFSDCVVFYGDHFYHRNLPFLIVSLTKQVSAGFLDAPAQLFTVTPTSRARFLEQPSVSGDR